MKTVTIPKEEYDRLKRENEALRNTRLYKRLLEATENVENGKVYTRKQVGI